MLNYKKPAFWIVFVAVVASIVMAVCFLTNSKEPSLSNVKINYGTSVVYTQQEMDSAIKLIKNEFATWEGCELHEIAYRSDDKCNTIENIKWMNELSDANGGRGDFTQCIMFESSFHSPKTNSGAFNPDEEYTGWQWWLARSEGGNWQLMTWGY